MSADYYGSCTPFLMGELREEFPKIKMAALCIGHYPADLAMKFITNGVNSYVTTFYGYDKWYEGLAELSKGRDYISPAVLERIYLREVDPMPAGKITKRHFEIIRLVCSGWKDFEIADVLHISRSTVDNHKTEIYTSLNVRNHRELLKAVIKLKYFTLDELDFCPKDFTVNPKPDKVKKTSVHIDFSDRKTCRVKTQAKAISTAV